MNIKETMVEAHRNAVEKGWWDVDDRKDPRVAIEKLCLIHAEVSEAVEEIRAGDLSDCPRSEGAKPVGYAVELADIAIRLFDLAEAQGISLSEAIQLKMAYNKTRPHRHGEKLA